MFRRMKINPHELGLLFREGAFLGVKVADKANLTVVLGGNGLDHGLADRVVKLL